MSETSKQLWGFCESCHCQQIAICQDCKRLLREAIIDDEADLKAFMSSHAFQAGDEKQGWENQCAVIAPDGLRHCGGYREDHPMSNKSTLSDGWCEYANHLIFHGNDITALSMRTNLLADMNAHASHTAAIREKAEALVAKHIEVCEADNVFEMNNTYGKRTKQVGTTQRCTAVRAAVEGI